MKFILQIFHVAPSGRVSELTLDMLAGHKAPGYTWIRLDGAHPGARDWLIDDPDIDALATETLMAEDSRPRTIPHADCLLVNLRGVNLNIGSDVTDMVGIRFILTKNRIVSVEKRDLKATSDLVEEIKFQGAPKTPGGFLARFALILTERMSPTLTDLSEHIDDLEEVSDTQVENLDRTVLGAKRRDIIALRRFLAPQRDAINSFALQNQKWITDLDRLHIRSAADQTTRITEELDALRERCTVIRDHLTDHRAETLNRNMMLLSVVAAIFLPLGLISGMMGINVGGMPWTETGLGFWYVTGIVVGVGLLQLLFFKLLKWI